MSSSVSEEEGECTAVLRRSEVDDAGADQTVHLSVLGETCCASEEGAASGKAESVRPKRCTGIQLEALTTEA